MPSSGLTVEMMPKVVTIISCAALLICFVTQKKTGGARRRNAQKGEIKMGG